MKKIIGLGLVGMLSLVLAARVYADGGRGSGFHGVHVGMHGTGFQHKAGFQHRGNFHRGCCLGGAFVGWPVGTTVLADPYYAYPYFYPVYVPTPDYQPQPQVYLTPPAQSEVCYVGGCYRLQGDGMSVPFRWVWIPTVPEPPPAPPTAPPAAAPAPGALAPTDLGSPRPILQLYRWIDEQGIANWTNNREAVPERYRAQLKQTL
jgi:hypothetical protein